MKDVFSLAKKVAIVTGGNGGIGKGIVRGFASKGADIAIIARNSRKTETAVNEIKEEFDVRVLGLLNDVTDEGEVNRMSGFLALAMRKKDCKVLQGDSVDDFSC